MSIDMCIDLSKEARARTHDENAGDGRELGEVHCGQHIITVHLTHPWPRASSSRHRPTASGSRVHKGGQIGDVVRRGLCVIYMSIGDD